jgi:signal transduction histidine kinase
MNWPLRQVRRLWLRFLRLNLRERISVAMLTLVAIAATLVAVLAHFAGERLEENVNYDLLAEELAHYEQRLRADPSAEPLTSARLHIYRSINLAQLPRDIARLPPGVHRTVRRDGRSLRVLVRDGEFGRLYITYDVSDHERGQRIALLILMIGVGGTLALTTWAAWRISQPLLAPVDRLARRLSQIDPRQRHVRFAQDFAGNELEPIASSIDNYLARLDGFVEREQAFTSTASHELRTPLAVVQGAVELLAEQYGNDVGAAKALERIQRAVREMSEFTAALLSLARESDMQPDASCDLTVLLPRIVDDQLAAAAGKRVELQYDPVQALRVAAPDSMVAMVVGNVVRNALTMSLSQVYACAR